MSQTGLDVFDTTLHQTNAWLKDIHEKLGWGDRQLGYHALRSTLQTLRDRIPHDPAAHLAAHVPATQIEKVRMALGEELQALWPEAAAAER